MHLAESRVVGFHLIRGIRRITVQRARPRVILPCSQHELTPVQAGIHEGDHRRLTRDEVVRVWHDYLRYYRLTMTVLSSVKVSIA